MNPFNIWHFILCHFKLQRQKMQWNSRLFFIINSSNFCIWDSESVSYFFMIAHKMHATLIIIIISNWNTKKKSFFFLPKAYLKHMFKLINGWVKRITYCTCYTKFLHKYFSNHFCFEKYFLIKITKNNAHKTLLYFYPVLCCSLSVISYFKFDNLDARCSKAGYT